ncbi:MAG: hypothetical protein H7338_08655 [Candidatus Sericytochromatia bacterium]|nr:hypothetical protein [Candidatus Sericytochromatia bacterium]
MSAVSLIVDTEGSAEYLADYLEQPTDFGLVSMDLMTKVAGYIEQLGKKTFQPRPVKEKKRS